MREDLKNALSSTVSVLCVLTAVSVFSTLILFTSPVWTPFYIARHCDENSRVKKTEPWITV